jgi:hypothetical protein
MVHAADLDGSFGLQQIATALKRESLNNKEILLERHLRLHTWKKRGGKQGQDGERGEQGPSGSVPYKMLTDVNL